VTGSAGDFDKKRWELYNIQEDFSEAVDLAAQQPDKLKEMKALFDQEAGKFGVYPLDDRFVERGVNPERPSLVRGRDSFAYSAGTVRIPEGNAPPIYQRSHRISADIVVPKGGKSNGVIVAEGGSSGGYTLFVKDGKPVYEFNFFGEAHYRVASTQALPPGKVNIVVYYAQRPFKRFVETTGGTARLYVNDRLVGEGEIANVVPGRFSATETLDIGMDLGAPVSGDYRPRPPFAYPGEIHNVKIDLK
jgi:arylsulfatase